MSINNAVLEHLPQNCDNFLMNKKKYIFLCNFMRQKDLNQSYLLYRDQDDENIQEKNYESLYMYLVYIVVHNLQNGYK